MITSAYAQGAAAPAGGGFEMFVPLILIFLVFYFLLIRPQQKKMKQHRAMVEAVKKGDEVVTGGGIFGKVSKVLNEREAEIEVAKGVHIKVLKASLSDVLNQQVSPANQNTAKKAATKKAKTKK